MPTLSELELRFNVVPENDSCYLIDLHSDPKADAENQNGRV